MMKAAGGGTTPPPTRFSLTVPIAAKEISLLLNLGVGTYILCHFTWMDGWGLCPVSLYTVSRYILGPGPISCGWIDGWMDE